MTPGELGVASAAVALGRSWTARWVDREPVAGFRDHRQPFIFALWHSDLIPLLWFHRGHPTALLVSEHRDGRLLASAARRWGYRVINGSSTRQGASGLRHVIRTLRAGGEVAITPDGPRGPARVLKDGLLAAAQAGAAGRSTRALGAGRPDGAVFETGAVPIVPVAAAASREWRLRSWDALRIPRPFARVTIAYGPPVTVGPGRDGRDEARQRLFDAMSEAEDLARC